MNESSAQRMLQTFSKGLLLPVFLHLHNIYSGIQRRKIVVESVLAGILCWVVFTSHLFWSNPTRGTTSHRVDSVSVKMTILAFLIYIVGFKRLSRKSLVIFWTLFGMFLFFGFMSEISSSNNWCGDAHLFYHTGLHMVGIALAFYAFAPDGERRNA